MGSHRDKYKNWNGQEEHIISNEDECDLITPIYTSNGPDRFVDEHCRLALDNTKKDTSAFPAAKENLRSGMDISEDEKNQKGPFPYDPGMFGSSGLREADGWPGFLGPHKSYGILLEEERTVSRFEEILPENLVGSQEQEPPVRIKSVNHGGLPNETKTSQGLKEAFISLKSAKNPTYLKNDTEKNGYKADRSTNSPTEKDMDISSINWKKLTQIDESENSLRCLIKSDRIGFGTVFKVRRKVKLFKYEYYHFFMLLDIYYDNFTVAQVVSNFKGVIFETRVMSFKDADDTLFDFSRGVYFDESYVKETEREAIRLRVKILQSLCIHYGFGPNRWNCESAVNYIKYGTEKLKRSEADIFKARFFITGPFILWTVERLSTGVYTIARINRYLCKKMKKANSQKFRNCIRTTVCKVPVIFTPSLFSTFLHPSEGKMKLKCLEL